MQDILQHNQELKNEIIQLKADNAELTNQNESFARLILDLQETVKELKDEINRLKGQKSRPKFPPATLDKGSKGQGNSNAKQKTSIIPITGTKKIKYEEIVITPPNIPEGSRFKGYSDFHVEELNIEALKIKYRLAVYETPLGEILRGRLPFNLNGKHFGPDLIAYCLDQYHGRCVTRPQLLEQLIGFGVDISAGELDSLLIINKDVFHEEKAAVFEAGITYSDQLNADDTGARHNGKNGVCTHIGSPLFCYFTSTFSKSRINFLEILRGKHIDYILSEDALLYAFDQGVSERAQAILDDHADKRFTDKDTWDRFLKRKGITSEKDHRIATEAALMGSAIFHGLKPTMGIMSDAAGQFNILIHALCWIHEERHYRKFVSLTENEKELIDGIRDTIWNLYEQLKEYKVKPAEELRKLIEEEFDGLFSCETESSAINDLLKNTMSRREGLLKVLDYPWLMLHNNDSERDIREYVKKRKISGSTRSESGRKARDTFASLKKTCKKLGVCFWDYLRDRTGKLGRIKSLSVLIAEKAMSIVPGQVCSSFSKLVA
ncbi:MAG TPA: transposase [Ignavibacteriaceae bacterium]